MDTSIWNKRSPPPRGVFRCVVGGFVLRETGCEPAAAARAGSFAFYSLLVQKYAGFRLFLWALRAGVGRLSVAVIHLQESMEPRVRTVWEVATD